MGNTVLYGCLLTGGTPQVFTGREVLLGERMLKMDCLKIVPSHWKALQEKERVIAPGRCLIFGGERLTGEAVGLLRAGGTDCEVYNHYGPSETTIGKALGRIDLERGEGKIPLGTPFGRTRIPAVRCADQLAAGGYHREHA